MRQFYFIILFLGVFTGILTSCNDDKYTPHPPSVSIENLSGTFATAQDDTLVLKAKVESPLETTLAWFVNGKEASIDSIFKFTTSEVGNHEIKLTATNADGDVSDNASVEIYEKYKYGTFILNEGAALRGDKGGSLIFINPKGTVMDTVYRKENDGAWLGSVPQDLFIANNKMYIVSQNGGNEGYLVIANARTLKKEVSFQSELNGKVSNPTHVAVLGDNEVYLRDNKGVYLFNPTSLETTFIKGTEGARKNTMAVAGGKVFASKGKTVLVIEKGKDEISHTIEFDGNVSGIIKSSDGNLWVSCASGNISKINAKDYSFIGTNQVSEDATKVLTASFAAAPSITAKGDTLYMSGLASKIYRHIFSTKETRLMVDIKDMVENVGVIYNTVAVNPVTGEVIMNSIKGYGANVEINHISVFDFSGAEPKLNANYENHTRYPAGTFFTYNFE